MPPGDDRLPSFQPAWTDLDISSWQISALENVGDARPASPNNEQQEQFLTSAIQDSQTFCQPTTTASSDPIIYSEGPGPVAKDAVSPLIPQPELRLSRKRRRSRTRPLPGYMCFDLGLTPPKRSRNEDQIRNAKEVAQAGGSCFLCRLHKKKVGEPHRQ